MAQTCASAMRAKNVSHVFHDIHLKVEKEVLTMTGGSPESQVISKIDTDGDDMELLIDSEKLISTLKTSKEEEAELQKNEKQAVIKLGRSKTTFQTQDPGYYPIMKAPEASNITVRGGDLREAIKRLSFVSFSDLAPHMSGYHLVSHGSTLHVQGVAQGAHILGESLIPMWGEGPVDIILPVQAYGGLTNILKNADAELSADSDRIQIECDRHRLLITTLNGTFPDCKKVLDREYENKHSVNKEALKNALEQSRTHINVNGLAQTKLSFDKEKVQVRAESEISSFETEIECQGGGEKTVTVNPNIMLQGIQGIRSDNIMIGTSEQESSLIHLMDAHDDDHKFGFMPLVT